MRAIIVAGCFALTATTGVWAQQLQVDVDQSHQMVPLDQLELRSDFTVASGAHLEWLADAGRGIRPGLATLQRDLERYLRADPASRRALVSELAPRLLAEADLLDERIGTIERGLSTPTHRAALAEAGRLTPHTTGAQRLEITAASVEQTVDDLQRIIATLDIVIEDVRNRRQEFQTSFENFDQKANQLFNILSTVLRSMNEMRSAVLRNMN